MSNSKSAKALVATEIMNGMIMERFLANALPKSNSFCLKQAYKYTGYRYYSLREYIHSDLYIISKDTIDITDNAQLLSDKSKKYFERLIKKAVYPSRYENNEYVYVVAKLYDNSYFTEEEQKFIKLMTDELFSIINQKEIPHRLSRKDLLGFHCLNCNSFVLTARRVYNDILQKKLRAGDYIKDYIKENLTDVQVADVLENSCKFDYFFDSSGILKCDLDTNENVLIKNFLSTIFYDLTDDISKIILLQKLNEKYPFLINEKNFDEYV